MPRVPVGLLRRFPPDFDGVKVTVDGGRSTAVPDTAIIQAALQRDTGLPIRVAVGSVKTYDGINRFGDAPPYSGGGAVLGASFDTMCTSGFGVVYGSSVHRYISARHCEDTPYGAFSSDPGVYGSITKYGGANSGAAVFSAVGASTVFDDVNTSGLLRAGVTQRDPALSTVGTAVCQEGANSRRRCGTIAQVALLQFGGIAPYTPGSQCPNQWWEVDCTANFTFNNIDYAMASLPGYAMYYACDNAVIPPNH